MSKVAAASFVGGLLEWYDFYIYATASALVFGRVFFPTEDPLTGTMASFGAFAAGFIARPIGGLLFGHIGDRIGRKASLMFTLTIIGTGTFLIGCLPNYESWGAAAPALLVALRIAQGIGLGGEYGGASLMIIEHAPVVERTFWGSLPQAASPAGLLCATGIFGLVSLLPEEPFLAWGWRIPFLLSAVALAVGVFVRLHVDETPDFKKSKPAKRKEDAPAVELVRKNLYNAVLATGARLVETTAGNMIKSFGLTYVTLQLGMHREVALNALTATAVVGLLMTPVYGWLGDRLGQRFVYMVGTAFVAVFAFPFFWILDHKTAPALWLGFIVAYNLGPTLLLSVQSAFFTRMFGTRVRYTGLSVAYQLSAIIGGFTPLIALWLLRHSDGEPWLTAGFLTTIAVVSLVCASSAVFIGRTRPNELMENNRPGNRRNAA